MKRRTYIVGAASIGLSIPIIGESGQERRDGHIRNGNKNENEMQAIRNGRAASTDPEPAYTLLDGTKYETEVYVIDAPESGPTGVVIGGMHGDERSGYHAAAAVSRWQFDAGRVVVLPQANQPAIKAKTRHGVGGDLNRTFPPGEEPTTTLAQAIWNDVVLQSEPDFLLDLHRSKGIYRFHESFVGQAIYPTDVGDAPSNAVDTIASLNADVVPWYMPYHDFKRGNVMHGTSPLLAHKAGGDLQVPAYIVETTTFLTDLETRTRWTKRAAEKLLSLHGINRTTETERNK